MEQPPCGLKVYKFASFREYMLTFEHHHPHYRLLPAVVFARHRALSQTHQRSCGADSSKLYRLSGCTVPGQ